MANEEIDALKLQMAEIQLAIEKAEREEALKQTVTTLSNGKINFDTIMFSVYPVTPEFTLAMENLGSVKYDPYTKRISVDVDAWKIMVHEALSNNPLIKLTYPDELAEAVAKWTPPAHVFIHYNKEHTYIVFDLAPNASNVPLRSDCVLLHNLNKYALLISSLAFLDDILKAYAEKYPKLNVVLDDPVAEDLAKLRETNEKLSGILSGDGSELPPITLGPINLRNFQVQSVEFLKYNDGDGIVALEMGLGKTPVMLAYIDWYWRFINPNQKFLIVGPASLRPNWTAEVRKYLNLTMYQLYNTKPSSMDIRELVVNNEYKIFYANYEVLSRAMKYEENSVEKKVFPWPHILTMAELRVGIDEAHYLKNPESARAKAMFECEFKSVALLTGTPMKNGPKELYSLVKLINPDFAGSYQGWEVTHTRDNGRRAKDPEKLRRLLAPIMIRKLKKDVIKDLPPINRITLPYELTPTAKGLYNQVLQGFYQDLLRWDGDTNNSDAIQNMLVQLMRMKQVTSADKVDFVVDRAQETYDSDESDYRKVIIFSQFSNEPPIVQRIASGLGHEALWFTGNQGIGERHDLVEQFQNDDDIHYLVCSTRSAAEGLNITKAGHVIFTDLMWSPADHSQPEGRAYGRLSDLHSITSTYVIAEGTVDEHIVGILMRKMGEIMQTIDGMSVTNESIATELLGKMRNLKMLS